MWCVCEIKKKGEHIIDLNESCLTLLVEYIHGSKGISLILIERTKMYVRKYSLKF